MLVMPWECAFCRCKVLTKLCLICFCSQLKLELDELRRMDAVRREAQMTTPGMEFSIAQEVMCKQAAEAEASKVQTSSPALAGYIPEPEIPAWESIKEGTPTSQQPPIDKAAPRNVHDISQLDYNI